MKLHYHYYAAEDDVESTKYTTASKESFFTFKYIPLLSPTLTAVFEDVTQATLIEVIPEIAQILIPQQKNNNRP